MNDDSAFPYAFTKLKKWGQKKKYPQQTRLSKRAQRPAITRSLSVIYKTSPPLTDDISVNVATRSASGLFRKEMTDESDED